MEGKSAHFSFKRGGLGRARKHAAYVIGVEKFSTREDVAYVGAGNMPTWATDEPLMFWEAADANERANGRTYSEFEFAIPRELTPEQAKELVEIWIAETLGDRHPWTYGIHAKRAEDGLPNIHCHLMFSDRLMDGVDRPLEQFFRRPATRYRDKKTGELRDADPAKGGAGKDRRWSERPIVKELRTRWESIGNQYLVAHGFQPRLDLRSNAARGLDDPEPKIGPEKRKGDQWRERTQEKVKKTRQRRRRVRELSDEIKSVKSELRTSRREYAARNAPSCRNERSHGHRPHRTPLGGMKAEPRKNRTVYRWGYGAAAGLAAIVDRGDQLTLVGKASLPKACALVELAKAKGWTSLVLTGSDEFKRLAVREALREGLRIANPELASIVADEEKKLKEQIQHQARNELARQWLVTAAPVTAIEASTLKNDPERLRQLFDTNPEARRWELIRQQRAEGVPEPLLGLRIERDAQGVTQGTIRHVGKRAWIEPHDRPGVVVPVTPSQPMRPGQRVAVQRNGDVTPLPDRENTPRPR